MEDGQMAAAFSVGQIKCSHWDFDVTQAWRSDCWLAEATIDAENYKAAFGIFRRDMSRVVPRISLISQTYTEFLQQPFLIVREGQQIGFLRYTRKRSGVGLMFIENHREALVRLLEDTSIPEEFYYYWNDVVNAVGYTPKLVPSNNSSSRLMRHA
jgi:hypothetical protein